MGPVSEPIVPMSSAGVAPSPRLSFVVPAFNEEQTILPCLQSIREACRLVLDRDWVWEIVVVDNNSSDRTGDLARQTGAHVVFEKINRISVSRNAGARQAQGEWLIFIDADSILSPALLDDTVAVMASGAAIGGGAVVAFPSGGGLSLRLGTRGWNALSRTLRWAAGSYLYVRTEDFRDEGGFDESFYYAEEIDLSERLKRRARRSGRSFVILRNHPVLTSDRKFRQYRLRDWLPLAARVVFSGGRSTRSAKNTHVWYDGKR